MQEASWLSSLLPELNERGVSLYGIVHEEKGANSFNDYLKGEMLYDKEVSRTGLVAVNSNVVVKPSFFSVESLLWSNAHQKPSW